MNHLKRLLVVLGLSVVGLVALAPSSAFARGGAPHGGGFHAAPAFHGGGFRAAPTFHSTGGFRGGPCFHNVAAPGYHGGYHGVGPRLMVGPRYHGPAVGFGRPFGQAWVPGYWRWNGGVRVWIAGAYMTPPYPGWFWVAAHWSWNGVQWVWQDGYWAPPQY